MAGLVAVASLSQCGIHEQVQQAKAFKKVDVRLASIDQATVGGVNVLNLRQAGDLGTAERALLVAAATAGNLPLRMRANLEFRNPNDETAALNEFDYLAYIDGKEVAKGHSTQRIEVPANGGVATAPVLVESTCARPWASSRARRWPILRWASPTATASPCASPSSSSLRLLPTAGGAFRPPGTPRLRKNSPPPRPSMP